MHKPIELHTQVDIENLELVDMDQLDMDEKGEIRPSARGLGADLKQQWYSAIDEEVRKKLKEREEAMKAGIQVGESDTALRTAHLAGNCMWLALGRRLFPEHVDIMHSGGLIQRRKSDAQ